MQRKIAEELQLGHKTMAILDKQDEEGDFDGVDPGSRDVIRSVAATIDQALSGSRFMVIFLNGSDDEIPLSGFGIPEYRDCIIIWTFRRRPVTTMNLSYRRTSKIKEKLRSTDLFLSYYTYVNDLSCTEFDNLFGQEAASILTWYPGVLPGINHKTGVDCCLYRLLLYRSFNSTNAFVWPAHGPNYWICDGIIEGDRAWEISNALHPEIISVCDPSMLDILYANLQQWNPYPPLLVVKDDKDIYEKRPYRWISITLKKNRKVLEGMQTIFARASSIFLAFEIEDSPCGLPNGFFKQFNNLHVLVLSRCAFSFMSPPFLHCHTLRFLGLDHCSDETTILLSFKEWVVHTKWAFLESLWVIDLYYTDWVEIFSEGKIGLMDNLMELNIGGRCSQLISQLQKRLPCLRRLRIIKPMHEAAKTSSQIDINNTFMDKPNLEVLDLSGNKSTKHLPTSISKESQLQVLILDGCDGLENVVVPNILPSSLRSFSFDGYGPAFHRTSTVELPSERCRPEHLHAAIDKKDIKASIISLEGCTQLENLFLRGLPNLVELELSGCPIKVLDFKTTVVDVPRLKRLFLLGCERLRAINWGSHLETQWEVLELLCIDTRSSRVQGWVRTSLGARRKSSGLHVHAVTEDARLARSLWDPINFAGSGIYFSINITASRIACSRVVQLEETSRETTESRDGQHFAVAAPAGNIYGDTVFCEADDTLMTPMQAFPQPPTEPLDRHIEIGDGSRNVQSEAEANPDIGHLAELMRYTQSLYVHDVSSCSNTMATGPWHSLRWCRVERCPNLHAVFPPGAEDDNGTLETIWVSDLLMARCIWSKGEFFDFDHFQALQHLHLRRCPSLRFALAMGRRPFFRSLVTLHIIHCGDIRHIFVSGSDEYQHTSVQFPKLTAIHLHDLPALQQICEDAEALAPALETIKLRGCPNLRRLPSLMGREPSMRRRPAVEVEKDVWDALEWDGVDAGHHPSLYETPVHSRYYKRSRLLRGTVLR